MRQRLANSPWVASTCRKNDFFSFVGDCPAEPDAAFYGYGQNRRCGRRCQQSASFRTERNCRNRFAAVINAVLPTNSKALEAFDAGFVVDGFASEVNTAGWTPVAQRPQETHCSELIRIFLRAWTASRPRRVPTGQMLAQKIRPKNQVRTATNPKAASPGSAPLAARTEKSVGVNQANDGNRAAEQHAEENGSKKIFGRTVLTIAGAASEKPASEIPGTARKGRGSSNRHGRKRA